MRKDVIYKASEHRQTEDMTLLVVFRPSSRGVNYFREMEPDHLVLSVPMKPWWTNRQHG